MNASEHPETAPELRCAITSAPRGTEQSHPGCDCPGKGPVREAYLGQGAGHQHGPGVMASARWDSFPRSAGHTLAAFTGDKATP